jgi:chemotaxis protein CheX
MAAAGASHRSTQVDKTYIMPFIKSVQNVFETMLQMPVEIGNPGLKKTGDPSYDVSGIIGMSGDIEGAVVLSFPTATAERTVCIFTGTELARSHPDFVDAIGELVNMVSGGAKAQFEGKKVSITCPSVVIGGEHVVFGQKDVVSIHIPCACDAGPFAVEVSIRRNSMTPAADRSAKATVGA